MKFEGIDDKLLIYGMLFAISNRIQTIGDGQFEDITMKQHFMMVALEMVGDHPPTLREMGDLIGCSYQNVKRMAIALEKNGYLSIITDSDDKRKLLLVPTGKFQQLADNNQVSSKAFIDVLYQDISNEHLKIVLSTLIQMEENLKGGL